MKAYPWLVVLVLRAAAVPLVTSRKFPDETARSSEDSLPGSSPAKAFLSVGLDHVEMPKTRDPVSRGGLVVKRQASPRHSPSRATSWPLPAVDVLPVMSAEEASTIKSRSGGKAGVFYRGDSRPPSVVFESGFEPRGRDPSLRRHLSFVGDSGLVSLSRSPRSAEAYAFGRTGARADRGYVYVVSPADVPDGYWVPGLFSPDKNPAVAYNQEFAVAGRVPGSSVSHAYEVYDDNPSDRSRKIRNGNYALRDAPGCFLIKRTAAVCDPAKFMDGALLKIPASSAGRQQRPGTAKTEKSGSSAESLARRPAHGKGRAASSNKTPTSVSKPRTKSVTRLRAAGRLGMLATVTMVAPYAHRALDALREWNHPIGHAVAWFDDAVNNVQEAIGGTRVPEIHGNELKLKVVCWIRGEQRHPDAVDRACRRLRQQSPGRTDEDDERAWQTGLGQLLEACGKAATSPPADASLRGALFKNCEALQETILKLNVERTKLIQHRQRVQDRINAGRRLEPEDIDRAAEYISSGAFPSFPSDDAHKVRELAVRYMGDMKPEYTDDKTSDTTTSDQQPETDGESDTRPGQSAPGAPPAWVTASRVRAAEIPLDGQVGRSAFELVDSGPHAGLFDEAPPHGNETCYSPAGLAKAQPGPDWDSISAALVYIEQRLVEGKRQICKACDRGAGTWDLACGSMAA